MGLLFDIYISTREMEQPLIFLNSIDELFMENRVIPEIKEFSDISFTFTSQDELCKLYLKELDDFEISNRNHDENKNLYFKPSEKEIIIFKYNKQDVPLVPGYYFFEVRAHNKKYFSAIKIIPKDLTSVQWEDMRDEIESKVKGLSLDFIKRKRSETKENLNRINQDTTLERVKKLSEDIPAVLASLEQLKKEAKFNIKKVYKWKKTGSKAQIDFKTIKMMQKNPDKRGMLYSADRILDYDTSENQWIKFILTHILRFVKNSINHLNRISDAIDDDYNSEKKFLNFRSNASISFTETRYKNKSNEIKDLINQLHAFLIYVNEFLKENYFSSVSNKKSFFIPKTLILSAKYNIIYKMYLRNIRTNKKRLLDESYNYFWRKTDLLYEIWSYIKTIDALIEIGFVPESGWIFDINLLEEPLPFLSDGTRVKMLKDSVAITVVFNEKLKNQNFKNNLIFPLKTSSKNSKPDIRVDLFDEEKYAGSIILDAKYKKLVNIISYNKESINQLRSYRNDPFSSIIDLPEYLNKQLKSVVSVFAIYPINDRVKLPDTYDEQMIFFSELRPGHGFDEFVEKFSNQINDRLELYRKVNKN